MFLAWQGHFSNIMYVHGFEWLHTRLFWPPVRGKPGHPLVVVTL